MPISLKPVSRRSFIAKGTLAALACFAKFPLIASAASVDKNYVALFSDTHIAANLAELSKGVNMADHLDSVVREVLSAGGARPTALLVNGDCAYQMGEEADYATFVSRIKPLRDASIPIHLTLGHEVAEHFVGSFKTSRANWYLMDSLDKTNFAPGMVGQPQLDWLAAALDKNKRTPAIVVVHHNPVFAAEKKNGLLDTDGLMEVLRPRKQVKAVIYGHTHTWKITRDTSGIQLINLPPIAYVFEEGQPSGWVKAMVQKNGIELELSCLDKTHPSHGQKVSLEWRT